MKACNQFKSISEAWTIEGFTHQLNGRGVELVWDKKEIKKFYLIVVYALVDHNGDLYNLHVMPLDWFKSHQSVSLHIFTLQQFEILLKLLDTLPDFLIYLEFKNFLLENKLIKNTTDVVDIYSFVTFGKKKLLKTISNLKPINIDGFAKKHSKSLSILEHKEIPSYLVDYLIEWLYDGVNSSITISQKLLKVAPQIKPAGTLDAYQHVIPYLARLSREDRTRLSNQYSIVLKRAICEQRISYRGLKFPSYDEGYLILCAPLTRPERQIALYNLAKSFAFKMKLKKIIAIASSIDDELLGKFDVMVVDAVPLLKKGKIHESLVGLFEEPR